MGRQEGRKEGRRGPSLLPSSSPVRPLMQVERRGFGYSTFRGGREKCLEGGEGASLPSTSCLHASGLVGGEEEGRDGRGGWNRECVACTA